MSIADEIIKNLLNGSINDFESMLKFLMLELQNYYDFTFKDALAGNKSALSWYNGTDITVIDRKFVFIDEDPAFNPKIAPPWRDKFSRFVDATSMIQLSLKVIEMFIWKVLFSGCAGLVLYDFNNNTYNMGLRKYMALPTIYINGTIGKEINKSISDYRISYELNQTYNESVKSYNVIGQINGTKNETVIICSLYDSWWCQGTADAAIGMSIVLALSKYYKTHVENPPYTLKFIGFGGEEYGFIGARHYEANHSDEIIHAVIDANQVGFSQSEHKLTLNIIANNRETKKAIDKIIPKTEYLDRINNTAYLKTWKSKHGAPSNDRPFAINRSETATICLLKDFMWMLHHRDGLNHTEGDVMKYYYDQDVNATAQMMLNITYGIIFKKTTPGDIWPFIIAITLTILVATTIILTDKKRGKKS